MRILSLFSQIVQKIYFSNSGLYLSYLRRKGVSIGEGTAFFGHVTVDSTRPCLVEIGKNCILTDGVILLTHSFDWAVLREKYHEVFSSSGKLVLEDNVFIGTNAVVLKGVKIGRNTIIGAGSIVTHDIPANSVAAGNPRRVIMSLDEFYEKRKRVYVEEAKAYAREMYLKTQQVPKIEDFWEEFLIFLQRDADWGKLPVRGQLGPAYTNFMASKPLYKSFKEFLIDAGIPREKVEAT